MIQTWRFPIVLALSVVFGMPALHAMMTSPDQLFRSGFAYLGALGLSWLGVNSVFGLMDHYATNNQRLQAVVAADADATHRLEVREADVAATAVKSTDRRVDDALPGAVI